MKELSSQEFVHAVPVITFFRLPSLGLRVQDFLMLLKTEAL